MAAATATRSENCLEGCPPCLPTGGPGALFLYTGRLPSRPNANSVDIVIDDDEIVALPLPSQSQAAESPVEESMEVLSRSLEADLMVEDYDHIEDADGSPLLLQKAPGAFTGRRLMMAKAQQCVVCLTDSEHTFVPPHRRRDCSERDVQEQSGACPSRASRRRKVDGHRFCSDCWSNFIEHHMEDLDMGKRRVLSLARLACPVCRDPIEVPDVWSVRLGLHQARCRESACRIPSLPEDHSLPHETTPVAQHASGYGELTPCDFWASRRSAEAETSESAVEEVAMEFDISPKSHFRGEIDEYQNLEVEVEPEDIDIDHDETDVSDAEADTASVDEDWSTFWTCVFFVLACILWRLYVLLLYALLSPLALDTDDWCMDLDSDVWGFLGFEQGVLL